MGKHIETLTNAIISLGQPNWIDYMQATISIFSILISLVAVVMATMIPREIAHKQDKIALFDKRFAAFEVFQKYISFTSTIKEMADINNYKNSLILIIFDTDQKMFYEENFAIKIEQLSLPLKQMPFLFKDISENEVEELVLNLLRFVAAIIANREVEECKKQFVGSVENFDNKYSSDIRNLLKAE